MAPTGARTGSASKGPACPPHLTLLLQPSRFWRELSPDPPSCAWSISTVQGRGESSGCLSEDLGPILPLLLGDLEQLLPGAPMSSSNYGLFPQLREGQIRTRGYVDGSSTWHRRGPP